MLWFHLFTEIKQHRNNLFLWSPMAFAFGIAATFAHGHWIGPALFIFLLICVLGYLSYFGVKDSAILPPLMLLFVATLGAGAAGLRSYMVWALRLVIRIMVRFRVSLARLATAPIAAIHFNQINQIGYIANLLAVPDMALIVAPAAVIVLALSPLHLAPVGFWFVNLGLTWIQFVAGYLAQFDLAVRMIKTPMEEVLPLFSFGVLWCVLWSGKYGKSIGIIAAIIAVGLWGSTQRPEILIADQGRLI